LLPLDDVSDPNSELSRSFDREHDTLLALRAMSLVKPDFQASTWLAFLGQVVEGRNAHEVSEELQMSLNAVIKAKSRVLRRIRTELQYLI
jgi:RNA polymerase sigma-70 factor (ECF subfamily)